MRLFRRAVQLGELTRRPQQPRRIQILLHHMAFGVLFQGQTAHKQGRQLAHAMPAKPYRHAAQHAPQRALEQSLQIQRDLIPLGANLACQCPHRSPRLTPQPAPLENPVGHDMEPIYAWRAFDHARMPVFGNPANF